MPPKRDASQGTLFGYFGNSVPSKKPKPAETDNTENRSDNNVSGIDNDTDVSANTSSANGGDGDASKQNKSSVSQSQTKQSKESRHKKYDAKRKRSFRESWKTEYPWVNFDEDEGVMFCEICRKYPKLADQESQLFKGAGDSKQGFRKDTLRFHHKSKSHVKCELADKAQAAPKSTPMAQVVRRMNKENVERFKCLFNTAYYVVSEHLAFRKFEGLCQLQQMNGVYLGKNYINDHGCKDFIMAIASVLKSETIDEISQANYFTILADGSTDSAIIEQEA